MRFRDSKVRLELAKALIAAGRSAEQIPGEIEKLEAFIGPVNVVAVVPDEGDAVTPASPTQEPQRGMYPGAIAHQP